MSVNLSPLAARVARRVALTSAVAVVAALSPRSSSAAFQYWDANGTTAGAASGANVAPGIWGTDAFWTPAAAAGVNAAGTLATVAYTSSSDVVFSAGNDATGTFTVGGATGTRLANSIAVEEGDLTLAGGTGIQFTNANGGTGQLTVANGATLTLTTPITSGSVGFEKRGAGTLNLGGAAGGALNYTGTSLLTEGTIKLTGGTAGATSSLISDGAAFVVNGGTLDVNGRREGFGATATVGSLTLRGGSIVNTDANEADAAGPGGFVTIGAMGALNLEVGTLAARVAGTGAVNKATAGTVNVTGRNSGTGATSVTAGRLNFTGSWASGSTITVNGTGVLSGTGAGTDASFAPGSVGKVIVNDGGTVAPGTADDEAGILLVRGGATDGFTLNAGGRLDIELGGAAAGAGGYDRLIVTGPAAGTPVSLAGGVIDVSLINGFAPTDGALFFVLVQQPGAGNPGAISGTFAGLAEGGTLTTPGGAKFQIGYAGDSVGGTFIGGNDVVLRAIVPEPATLGAIGMAATLLLARRRTIGR